MKLCYLVLLPLLIVVLALTGCGGGASKDHKDHQGDKKKDADHKDHQGAKGVDHKDHGGKKDGDHEHKPAAHGGTVVNVGTDSYHAEVVFSKDGQVKLYPLGKDETKSISVENQTLKAYAKHEGADKAMEMELKPEPQKGDPKDHTSLFVGKLPGDLVGKKVTVTIPALMVEGERFRVEFSSGAGKHDEHSKDHKDHKDGKEHKEHKDSKKDEAKAGGHGEDEIREARAKLSAADRKLVEAQEWCAVMNDHRLGEMGDIVKVMVKDQCIFLCCKGCQRKALADPEKTLKKVEELKAKARAGA
ncbi:MAG: hypothetical protein HY040_22520 [Planctomycetes bacterium]|nr:hypothetical protein [Planctomycetota bacterium]